MIYAFCGYLRGFSVSLRELFISRKFAKISLKIAERRNNFCGYLRGFSGSLRELFISRKFAKISLKIAERRNNFCGYLRGFSVSLRELFISRKFAKILLKIAERRNNFCGYLRGFSALCEKKRSLGFGFHFDINRQFTLQPMKPHSAKPIHHQPVLKILYRGVKFSIDGLQYNNGF
jgi:hypothetical protein